MLRITQLKMNYRHSKDELVQAICKILKIKEQGLYQYKIIKRSVDARKKDQIQYVYTIDVGVENEKNILKRSKGNQIQLVKPVKYRFQVLGDKPLTHRPIIVGTGPAGLFCGLFLAQQGYRPILIERGEAVNERLKTVETFWESGQLNPNSNVQFGEGGAGTFSDGKLNTLVKDPIGRNQVVLETFAQAGAPAEITYMNKPHIGTDILVDVVQNIREEIKSLGGEFLFNSQVTKLLIEDGQCHGVIINDSDEICSEVVVLAIGHSARDTFKTLFEQQVSMEAKAFAVGVRVEHSQTLINQSQYGIPSDDILGAAEYKLTYQTQKGKNVYSFCMCPGGFVVNASSEAERLAINGMSYSKRDSRNANSAIIVGVNKEDFTDQSPLAGLHFQEQLEEKAFKIGGSNYHVPMQLFKDYKQNQVSKAFGSFESQLKGHYQWADLNDVFPEFINEALKEGIDALGRKIKGFDQDDVILTAVESRTSSPVRINRDENFESNYSGLYPCGEGAGYAGGITSAAMDGIKVAEAVAKVYQPMREY